MAFKPNLGPKGQIARILLGLLIISMAILSSAYITRFSRTIILLLGIFFLVEGFARYCVIQQLLGKREDKDKVR